jgi:tetratricopeptide (TPR) repeat protein
MTILMPISRARIDEAWPDTQYPAMRLFVLLAASAALVATPLSGSLGQGDLTMRPASPPPAQREAGRRATLDDLFARLAGAKDEGEAKGIANLIERRWSRSGSDTADLLMSRASEAIQAKEHALAVELLDRVITLQPEWAEAWNRRATAFFLLDDTASSMADLRQVLAREPRHFGAWAGLGHIYMSAGDKTRALEAYRKALALHPHIESLRPLVDKLTPEIDGRDI